MTVMTIPLTKPRPVKILSLNHLARLLKEDKNVLITIAQTAPNYYRSFDRFKKKDNLGVEHWRHIDNPTGALKEIQDRINRYILSDVAKIMPDYLTGGMPGRSVLKNAYPHIGKELIIGFDLEKCFENIGHNQIYAAWRALGCGSDVASTLTKLTTIQNRLPQGSPASTILCNLALSHMASEINQLASANGCSFTLYIDDITLSGNSKATMLIGEIIGYVRRAGMTVNRKKTHLAHNNRAQTVTGIITNKAQSVPNEKYQLIRTEIIELSKTTKPINVRLYQSVWGKIHHIVLIDKAKGEKLTALAKTALKELETYDGPKLKNVRTRPCRTIRAQHKVLKNEDFS
jgi:RNA-directed DNA polymerase